MGIAFPIRDLWRRRGRGLSTRWTETHSRIIRKENKGRSAFQNLDLFTGAGVTVIYYSALEVAMLLGMRLKQLTYFVSKKYVIPEYEGKLTLYTSEQLEYIDSLLEDADIDAPTSGDEYKRLVRGLKNREADMWFLGLRPEHYFAIDPEKREGVIASQHAWAKFLNGHWTKKKPACPGLYAVMALDCLRAQYRQFPTMQSIEKWRGWFWSEILVDPPQEAPCNS